ncbi:MAG: transcriptional regulator [Candidatus Methanomethylophilaceae archaeon]|nr:transcriptional regulator [Candidatus Methanomethylophilaceae archaeon]
MFDDEELKPPVKVPCEMLVTYVLPTGKGALAKELVNQHGLTQVEVSRLFGVTSAAISQYIKGTRGGNELIDKSAYKDDFYEFISILADEIMAGMQVAEALCKLCEFAKECGLIKALYVYEGYSPEQLPFLNGPNMVVIDKS